MRNYKRKTERKVCTSDMLEDAKKRLANGESKVAIAKSLGISEAALRQRLKKDYGAQTLGRFRSIFSQEQEEKLANHCKNLDDFFHGLSLIDFRRAVFQYAEANKVEHGFNQEAKIAGKEWTLSFMRRHRLSLRTPQQTSLAWTMGFNQVQMNTFFDNLSDARGEPTEKAKMEYKEKLELKAS